MKYGPLFTGTISIEFPASAYIKLDFYRENTENEYFSSQKKQENTYNNNCAIN